MKILDKVKKKTYLFHPSLIFDIFRYELVEFTEFIFDIYQKIFCASFSPLENSYYYGPAHFLDSDSQIE
jgi:hypothetical protein